MGADDRLFAMLVTKTDEFVSSRYIGAGRAVHSGQLARSKSAERCGSPAATSKGRRHFEAPTEPTGETSSYPTGYYLAQNGGRSSSFAAAFSHAKLLKRRLEKSFIVRLFTYNR